MKAEFLKGAVLSKDFPLDDRPFVLVAGRSNCGKSSLLNALTGQKKLARVSKTPGRTREINFFLCEDSFYLVDLPGYGFARAAAELVQEWGKSIPVLFADPRTVLVLVLADVRRGMEKEERQALSLARQHDKEIRFVLTKTDKCGRGELQKLEARWKGPYGSPEGTLLTSIKDRRSIEKLMSAILESVAEGRRKK